MPWPIFSRFSRCLQRCGQGVPASAEQIATIYPEIEALYRDLHQHPELSMQEQQTAKKIADLMEAAGYHVTPGIEALPVLAPGSDPSAGRTSSSS